MSTTRRWEVKGQLYVPFTEERDHDLYGTFPEKSVKGQGVVCC